MDTITVLTGWEMRTHNRLLRKFALSYATLSRNKIDFYKWSCLNTFEN